MKDNLGNKSTTHTILLVFTDVGQGKDTDKITISAAMEIAFAGVSGYIVGFTVIGLLSNVLKPSVKINNSVRTELIAFAGAILGAMGSKYTSLSRLPKEGEILVTRMYQYEDRIDCYLHHYQSNGTTPIGNPIFIASSPFRQFA